MLLFRRNRRCERAFGIPEYELLLIERLDDVRIAGNLTEVLIKWRGFEETERDWVEIASLKEYVPDILSKFIGVMKTEGMKIQSLVSSKLYLEPTKN